MNRLYLLKILTHKEITAKYRSSALGMAWSVLNPCFQFLVYYYVFSVIFKAKWGLRDEQLPDAVSPFMLFLGLATFSFFSEVLARSPFLLRENSNYIKKIIFPIELLPLTLVLSTLYSLGISYALMTILYCLVVGWPPVGAALTPLILAPLVFFVLGLSYVFSAAGVYFHDLAHLIPSINMACMFVTPVFYPLSMVPEKFLWIIRLNPLTWIIEMLRNAFFAGRAPDIAAYGVLLGGSLAFYGLGRLFFERCRKGFADEL